MLPSELEGNRDAVLQAMMDEINDFHHKKQIAAPHRLNAVQTCLDYLDAVHITGETHGSDKTDHR